MIDKTIIGAVVGFGALYGGIIFYRYGVAPRKLRKHTLPADPPLALLPLDQWPEADRDAATLLVRTLAAEGFTALGYGRIEVDPSRRGTHYTACWVDRVRGDVATIDCRPMRRLTGDWVIAAELSLQRAFADGTSCETAGSIPGAPLPRPPHVSTVSISQVHRPDHFIAIHRHWVDATTAGRAVAPLPASFGEFVRIEWRAACEWNVNRGYFRLGEDGARLVPTTRGMYQMSWRRLSPLRQWLDMRERTRGNRIVAAWEKAVRKRDEQGKAT